MNQKRTRKARVGSGARKHRTDKSRRKSPVVANFAGLLFLRHQKANRWPTEDSLDKAWQLIKVKRGRRQAGAIQPKQYGFTLYDACMESNPSTVKTLLLAASLKVKKIRRYPGWFLERVYNLKNRPIELI